MWQRKRMSLDVKDYDGELRKCVRPSLLEAALRVCYKGASQATGSFAVHENPHRSGTDKYAKPVEVSFEIFGRLMEARHRERDQVLHKALRPRESVMSLILGTSSAGLGTAILIVTITGLLGHALGRWSDRIRIMRPAIPNQYVEQFDPGAGRTVSVLKLTQVASIFTPSAECAIWAVLAVVLGLIGLGLDKRHRRLHRLSAIGVGIPFVCLFLIVLVMSLLLMSGHTLWW
jgi:hypothetical protein